MKVAMETSDYASEKRHYAGLMQGGQAASKQYLDAVPDKVTAVDECYAAFSDARELAAEVNALVSRFTGPFPPENTDAKGQAIQQAQGILSDLADNSRRTRDVVAYALKSLRRLESQLP